MFVLLDLSCCKDLHFLPLSEEKTLGIEGLITTERSQLGGKNQYMPVKESNVLNGHQSCVQKPTSMLQKLQLRVRLCFKQKYHSHGQIIPSETCTQRLLISVGVARLHCRGESIPLGRYKSPGGKYYRQKVENKISGLDPSLYKVNGKTLHDIIRKLNGSLVQKIGLINSFFYFQNREH